MELITRINEMKKEEHELHKQIQLLKRGVPGSADDTRFQNEQRKELELMDMAINKYEMELEAASRENQELKMRRPPRNLAPI